MSTDPKTRSALKVFLRTFLMPTLVGKSLVMFFGLNYSNHPGEGYGYGLAASLAFTFVTLVSFAWRYRNQEEF